MADRGAFLGRCHPTVRRGQVRTPSVKETRLLIRGSRGQDALEALIRQPTVSL